MTPIVAWSCWLVGAYLLGSVSFALILGKMKGIDIRTIGSGNVGATNVGRALGKKWGILCFLLDLLKGLVPVLGYRLSAGEIGGTTGVFMWIAVAAAAVLGHVFPVFLRFKGGKGVATSFGAVLGFWPALTLAGLAGLLVWYVTVKLSSYVALGSVLAAIALPILALLIGMSWGIPLDELLVLVGMAALLSLLVVVRHKSNIARMLAGTESKVKWAERGE